jgi:hypothetical protein
MPVSGSTARALALALGSTGAAKEIVQILNAVDVEIVPTKEVPPPKVVSPEEE